MINNKFYKNKFFLLIIIIFILVVFSIFLWQQIGNRDVVIPEEEINYEVVLSKEDVAKLPTKDFLDYNTFKVSFKYPKNIVFSIPVISGFDREKIWEIKKDGYTKDHDILPEIYLVDNSIHNITAFGTGDTQYLIIGKYNVKRIKRNFDYIVSDDSIWGSFPACIVQYHILDTPYFFCINDAPEEDYQELEDIIKIMIATFYLK